MPSAALERRGHPAFASKKTLLYVVMGDDIELLTYPGLRLLKTLVNDVWPGGAAASNPNNGDVCFANYGFVEEYKHGSSKFYTIFTPSGYYEPSDCAFDPTTNNLAITYDTEEGFSVAVYTSPSSSPTVYKSSGKVGSDFLAYDDQGNLFVDGTQYSGQPLLDELPKGRSQFTNLTINEPLNPLTSLQWDGVYMSVRTFTTIYRLAVSGSNATVVGKTPLLKIRPRDYYDVYVIQGSTIIGPSIKDGLKGQAGSPLGFWHYPLGGKPFHVVKIAPPQRKSKMGGIAVSVGH